MFSLFFGDWIFLFFFWLAILNKCVQGSNEQRRRNIDCITTTFNEWNLQLTGIFATRNKSETYYNTRHISNGDYISWMETHLSDDFTFYVELDDGTAITLNGINGMTDSVNGYLAYQNFIFNAVFAPMSSNVIFDEADDNTATLKGNIIFTNNGELTLSTIDMVFNKQGNRNNDCSVWKIESYTAVNFDTY